jgi:hypothetical protein
MNYNFKYNKNIDLFSETENVTFQHNLPGLRYTCASSPEASAQEEVFWLPV